MVEAGKRFWFSWNSPQLWRWRQNGPSKYCYISTSSYGITSQKINVNIRQSFFPQEFCHRSLTELLDSPAFLFTMALPPPPPIFPRFEFYLSLTSRISSYTTLLPPATKGCSNLHKKGPGYQHLPGSKYPPIPISLLRYLENNVDPYQPLATAWLVSHNSRPN
jgi:hypothetical protein